MAASTASITGQTDTLNGWFKKRYGKLVRLVPDNFKLQRSITFRASKLIGSTYEEPVELTQEHGFTNALASEDAFDLAPSLVAITQNATVEAYQLMLRSRFGIRSVARSKTDEQAFGKVYDLKVKGMYLAARRRVETELVFGNSGIGVGEYGAIGGQTITITSGTWAPGVWAGMENASVNFFVGNTVHGTGVTNNNALVSAVNLDLKQITFDVVPTNAAVGDQLWFGHHNGTAFLGMHGSSGTRTAMGIHRIIGSGHNLDDATAGSEVGNFSADTSLFGINPATYSLWRSTKHKALNTAMSFAHVNRAISRLVSKGLDEDMCLFVSPNGWAQLLDNESGSTIRRRDSGDMGPKTLKVGAEGIQFYTQAGTITIKASSFVPESVGYLMPVSRWERLGSTEPTFNLLGKEGEYFQFIPDKAAYELRLYSDQAAFCEKPGLNCVVYDINAGA